MGRRRKNLCIVVIDLEKAYDVVPKEVLKWAFMRKGVLKMDIIVIEDIYGGSCTSAKSMWGKQRIIGKSRISTKVLH